MFTVLLIIQVLLGVVIIALVLLQQGKGADMGAAFGAGASGTVFGARGGSSFFTRATAVLATLFFANSILLSSPVVMEREDIRASVTEGVPVAGEETIVEEEVVIEEPAATDLPPSDLPDVSVQPEDAVSDLPPAEEPAVTDDGGEAAVVDDPVSQDDSGDRVDDIPKP
jgi:preprotein translocase subunit SecG